MSGTQALHVYFINQDSPEIYQHVIMNVAKINVVFANETLAYRSRSIAHCCLVLLARKSGVFKFKKINILSNKKL